MLTSWRTFATISANVGPERLKVITPASATTFKVVAASEYANSYATVDNAAVPFPTRIPVLAGDLIALGVGPITATQSLPHCLLSGEIGGQWMSKVGLDDPVDATSALTWGPLTPPPNYRVSVSATLEPDLDHDGFGDETQDRCVAVAGSENGCPPAAPPPAAPPVIAPALLPPIGVSAMTIAPRSFPAAPSGPSAVAARRSYGAKVGFTLSEAANVRFTVTRATAGRRATSGRCVAATRRNRGARACTRAVPVPGGFSRPGPAGPSRFRFSGRIAATKLAPGRYRLIATPSQSGRAAAPASIGFTIVR